LLSNDLTNILIVVVRYFGGTLLGVSGLINAYKKAAIDAISQANIVTHVLEENYFLSFDYPLQNPIMRIINDENLTLIQSTFGMKCEVEIGIRLTSLEIALGKFSKIEGLKITPLT